MQTAETMAFVTLSLCELFRAFTVRSERLSLFQIGLFSNPGWLGRLRSVASAAGGDRFCAFPEPVFNTHPISLTEWGVVVGLALIPALIGGDHEMVFASKGIAGRNWGDI